MLLILLSIGLFFLFLSMTSFLFPLFFLLIPLVFLFARPSVKVFTRKSTTLPGTTSLNQMRQARAGNVIDAEFTEHKR